MIVYNKYVNSQDHTWYDSSNVVYSKCYDNDLSNKTLKIVFKNGRSYLYKDVEINDYIQFKNAQSNGQAVNTFIIKKYKGIRIADTEIEKLNELKENFISEDNDNGETKFSNLIYRLDVNEQAGEFNLLLNDKVIYNAIEGKVSIINLFKSMNINYVMNVVENVINESDENEEKIIV